MVRGFTDLASFPHGDHTMVGTGNAERGRIEVICILVHSLILIRPHVPIFTYSQSMGPFIGLLWGIY